MIGFTGLTNLQHVKPHGALYNKAVNDPMVANSIINAIKSRVNKGWPTGAVKLLNQDDVNILLDQAIFKNEYKL